ncbi:uncharacterized protein LOC121731148 [Aricia agestis]|uniref:uncharacterized protein LOC121731148 n=1 Tax=Aricia agestis TaxID=91739 RepID=UPI001C2098F1|nr:uncharacterized protein LOC121731148 [Aricia agestis]
MGALNIAEWTPDEVAEWMSGLDASVAQYVPELRRRGLNGAKLLTLRCDDLEYLGIHIIGHQELLLEAVEHLRNYHYEVSRECVQQLALRVSAAASSLARELRNHTDTRLPTQTLADVARTVQAIKPLVCWLDRWAMCGGALSERKAALLKLALEAATCAQRERFAEQPARAVAATAAAAAAVADYIIQDVADPGILQPATVEAVSLRQAGAGAGRGVGRAGGALGFEVVPSFCGHHQLAHIRFGSPAHACGRVHEGDEVVAVGGMCVIGWSGEAVERRCGAAGELALLLRRRGARPLPLPAPAPERRRPAFMHDHRYEFEFREPLSRSTVAAVKEAAESVAEGEGEGEGAGSSDSEALSPPASPVPPERLYRGKPRAPPPRRHSVCGGSPPRSAHTPLDQIWRELQQQRWADGDDTLGDTLYRRDKAVSCSTGLQLSPRPRTHLGVAPRPAPPPAPPPALVSAPTPPAPPRARLDKSQSAPTYDEPPSAAPLAAQPIPESPPPGDGRDPRGGQILDFLKCSSAIGEALRARAAADHEAINPVMRDDAELTTKYPVPCVSERRRAPDTPPPPPPRPAPAPRLTRSPPPEPPRDPPRDLPRDPSRDPPREPPVPAPRPRPRLTDSTQTLSPLRHISKHDIQLVSHERREMPPLNCEPDSPQSERGPERVAGGGGRRRDEIVVGEGGERAGVRAIFPTSKTRSLKKKNSILAKRREVCARSLAARGAAGRVWQRVRGGGRARWAERHLLLAHNLLYAYRTPEDSRASCMIYLEGWTVCAAGEVRSRAHAFKVYHTGTAFYFACESQDAAAAWTQLIHRATLLPSLRPDQMDLSKQYSETEYSESDSEAESERRSERDRERERERDSKSKFGSLRKLTRRGSSENVASLDRKYLRFFSRGRTKEETKPKSKQPGVPVPTEHYRSYRRAAPVPAPAPRPPKPIHYIHASNPNLLDFENSDFVTKPTVQPPAPRTIGEVGLVTLEQFMLQKQDEERGDLARRLRTVRPDVVYGDLPPERGRGDRGDRGDRGEGDERPDWKDSLRRNDKVHTGTPPAPQAVLASPTDSAGGGVSRLRLMFGGGRRDLAKESSRMEKYSHLGCPPTFTPETYSLRRPDRP